MNNVNNFKFIEKLNKELKPFEVKKKKETKTSPPIFIVGLPRSGSTVLLQFILETFKLGYIDNLSAKFWNIPEYGIALSNELMPFRKRHQEKFTSKLGFTDYIFGPHEFGYFWKRFFPYKNGHHEIKQFADNNALFREIDKILYIFDIPFIFKNVVAITLNIELISRCFDNALFILIERDKMEIGKSLLNAREKYNGTINEWISGVPYECRNMQKETPFKQVAAQIFYYEKKILNFKRKMKNNSRVFTLNYNKLCNDADSEIKKLETWFDKKNIAKQQQVELKNKVNKKEYSQKWEKELKEAFKYYYD